MAIINLDALKRYREITFRLPPEQAVTSPEQALEYVNQRGFIFFWPINGVDLPSLWTATAGERPVAERHDDPGHVTWGWKDQSLDKKVWYYGKILRRKATFISLELAPYFYALSENYGSPEEDAILAYEAGKMTQGAKQVYDALLEKGSMNTIDLRKEARLLNAKESLFNRALEDLQKDFKILPVGTAVAGAWRYSFRYDLTSRHFPGLMEEARPIGEAEARQKLVEVYLLSVGATQVSGVVKLFGWPLELVKRTVEKVVAKGEVVVAMHPGKNGEWLARAELTSPGQ